MTAKMHRQAPGTTATYTAADRQAVVMRAQRLFGAGNYTSRKVSPNRYAITRLR